MTQIEDLVRQALAETSPAPSSTDPLATLDRRVRRARRWITAGACTATAAVVAAVVVPLAVLGGNSSPTDVGVGRTPRPSPSASNLPGVTTLVTSGAQWVAGAAGEQPWLLMKDEQGTYVGQVGRDLSAERVPVDDQSSRLAVGQHEVWVWGTNGSGTAGMVTVIPSSGPAHELAVRGQVLGVGAVSSDALYVISHGDAGVGVYRYELTPHGIATSKLELPVVNNVVATADGDVWAQSGTKLVEVTSSGTSMRKGLVVDWGTGALLGATTGSNEEGRDGLWADDGRVIGLSPKLLAGCVSCAEGYRVPAAGRPGAIAEPSQGGLYISVVEVRGPGWQGHDDIGLYYYSPASVKGNTEITASLDDVRATSLAADPNGGVDYVDDQGHLNHWDPTAGAAAR